MVRRGAAVSAAAMAVPSQVVSNGPIAARIGVEESWIRSRTGIRERRIAAPHERVADFAADAVRGTLATAGCDPASIDVLFVATMTAEDITPNVAPVVAGRAGLTSAFCADVGAACTGWLTALQSAVSQVEAGRVERALVVGADLLSRVTDPDDRATAALFADGAGAVLVQACEGESRVGPVVLGTDPTGASWFYARRPENVIRMRGRETFAAAVDSLVGATRAAIEAADLELDDIDLFAYHQGNLRIIKAVGERLCLPPERVAVCIDRFGNTSAATIPMALADAERSGKLNRDDKVLLGAFGAGLTWGAAVLDWGVPDG
ncbi:MAG TPA: beta-ketoacyl-ACP synthase 3 [Solirubrobacterales bacterium]|nr:beta-ketoacyl-ACP synthase 3 [Solirubrobacterales bacterium]